MHAGQENSSDARRLFGVFFFRWGPKKERIIIGFYIPRMCSAEKNEQFFHFCQRGNACKGHWARVHASSLFSAFQRSNQSRALVTFVDFFRVILRLSINRFRDAGIEPAGWREGSDGGPWQGWKKLPLMWYHGVSCPWQGWLGNIALTVNSSSSNYRDMF